MSFHRDYDRIIFSNSFRRLSNKTQVHPLSKNDHVHDRLTHSLEVASVGRSLGLRVGEFLKNKGTTINDNEINPYDIAYIVQTACLAHDIGNPPFGHAGEEVIKEWFQKNIDKDFLTGLSVDELKDFQHLDGNAQSFRIVTKLENSLSNGGMRLTFATLGTLIKYPYTSAQCEMTQKSKFNFFQSEQEFSKSLFGELGLIDENDQFRRHPLSFLMEASDDICYGLLDLQDAIELKIIKLEDTKDIFISLCPDDFEEANNNQSQNEVSKVAKLVAKSIDKLARHVMVVFENNYAAISTGEQPKDLIELFEDATLKNGLENAKNLAKEKIFKEKRKIELELGSFNIIETLLNNLIPATYQQYTQQGTEGKLSFRNERALALMGDYAPNKDDSLYNQYQSVIDFIVGMTDQYAKHMAHQLNGMSY